MTATALCATTTKILQRMEGAGLVTRRRDLDDNRLERVYFTAAGRRKERAVTEQFLILESAIFYGNDERDRVFLRCLQ